MRRLFGQCASFLRNWSLLNRPEAVIILEEWAHELELRRARPPRLTWERQVPTVVSRAARYSRVMVLSVI
jgi:hypothetical protein